MATAHDLVQNSYNELSEDLEARRDKRTLLRSKIESAPKEERGVWGNDSFAQEEVSEADTFLPTADDRPRP